MPFFTSPMNTALIIQNKPFRLSFCAIKAFSNLNLRSHHVASIVDNNKIAANLRLVNKFLSIWRNFFRPLWEQRVVGWRKIIFVGGRCRGRVIGRRLRNFSFVVSSPTSSVHPHCGGGGLRGGWRIDAPFYLDNYVQEPTTAQHRYQQRCDGT